MVFLRWFRAVSAALLCFLLPAPPAPAQAFQNWRTVLAGTSGGLYSLEPAGGTRALWQGGEVRKIIRRAADWAILTSEGVFVSADLARWEARNAGLPEKTLKKVSGGMKTLVSRVQGVRDLEANPEDTEIMTAAVRNGVFLTRNGGRSWKSLGMPPFRTDGIKAAAAAFLPSDDGARELVVFCSHSVYGVYYLLADRNRAQWTELGDGLERLESTSNPDEVSDIAVIPNSGRTIVAAAQSFRSRVYALDWEEKRFTLVWGEGAGGAGGADSLAPGRNGLGFIVESGVKELAYPLEAGAFTASAARERQDLTSAVQSAAWVLRGAPNCLALSARDGAAGETITLNELWLLGGTDATNASRAANREGFYLPVDNAVKAEFLAPFLELIRSRGLNMVVIDMKDDYGRLRFRPENAELAAWGRVFRPVDIDAFLAQMKALGVYTVARIVAFKDPEAAQKDNGRYAVWDSALHEPWRGYRMNGESGKEYYDEIWVDPYSEDVWEYNASVAGELHRRGFDEIQFDYIRFPTDGLNLSSVSYRWQDRGMDMDSAIISFLEHVRAKTDAAISVDIYGANGWYRTSARTGQEVEMLAPLVDVICPMYYPSHFEQNFLAQSPAEERPYRIYFQGARRTRIIARNQVVVRPYVQAFYLNVGYDIEYYSKEYVQREVRGARNAGTGGFTYWNNSGRYNDVPLKGEGR